MAVHIFPAGVPPGKRLLDLMITIPAFVILLPVMLLLAAIVLIVEGPPVLFRQNRPGYRGEIFTLYKFRTMSGGVDSQGRPLPDSQRLTRLGQFLRASSLDELPELWNVLRGEMSIVGPRPLLVEYLPLYSQEQARRHEVLPGITGWAQVNGRNALTWEEKFRLDVWYVDHWSLWLDVKILLMSFVKVLRREGISQPGRATMEEFKGSQPAGDQPDQR
jgi:lipopolysaccharide/colanic/teichoic acid biosynthesis glycosyltransferase